MFLFEAISWTVDQTLKGIEKVDLGGEKGFKSFVRSNLLYVSLVDIGEALVYLVGMFVVLSFAFSNGLGDFVAVALWAVVQLCAAVFFLIVKSRRASRSVKLIRGGTRIPYYLGAAVVMGFVLDLLYGMVLDSSAGALVYGLELCVVVALGAAVYFGLLYAVEPEFRAMARSLMKREHSSAPTARREL
jgi:hypothetical protein